MFNELKTYQQPELVELGPASALTLGAVGCDADSKNCEKFNQTEL
jgi:hypothetical protein